MHKFSLNARFQILRILLTSLGCSFPLPKDGVILFSLAAVSIRLQGMPKPLDDGSMHPGLENRENQLNISIWLAQHGSRPSYLGITNRNPAVVGNSFPIVNPASLPLNACRHIRPYNPYPILYKADSPVRS